MIKVLLCTKDTNYVKRLTAYFNKEYRDKIEVNYRENMEQAISYSADNDIDVALFDSVYEEYMSEAVKNKELACFCAVLADRIYETKEGVKDNVIRIHKYQRADNLFKEILDLYTKYGKVKITRNVAYHGGCKVYAFLSPKGGCGTTTIARAYARKKAIYEKVLYLNLHPMAVKSKKEANKPGMDDIIMALKSRRNILSIKLQSAVSRADDQVEFFEACTNPMDLMDLTKEDFLNLIKGIRELNVYQRVILDIGATITGKEVELMKQADFNICVVDGNEDCVEKFGRLYQLLDNLGKREKINLLRKTEIFKNRWRRGLENLYEDFKMIESGWAPFVSEKNYEGIIERIAYSDSFDNLGIEYAE